LAALANLVNETESKILRTDNEVLTFLIKTTKNALESDDRRDCGWSAQELAKGI